MIYNGLILIEHNIKEYIENKLGRTGLLYRIYSRIKEKESIEEKIERKGYKTNGKLIQDIIGVRVMTYFSEDIDVLIDYFTTIFDVISMEHDYPEQNQFNPVRINLVCRMQGDYLAEFNAWKDEYSSSFQYIDSTFEIQIRTTLSEGWHEIDHTLRYKCKNEWSTLDEESRLLNGIHATLETSDRTLFMLFEDIAQQHYKNKNWTGMLRNKFRLRFEIGGLSPEIIKILDENNDVSKQLYEIDRNSIITHIIANDMDMEITFDNIVFLCNYLFIVDEKLLKLTPGNLKTKFENINLLR